MSANSDYALVLVQIKDQKNQVWMFGNIPTCHVPCRIDNGHERGDEDDEWLHRLIENESIQTPSHSENGLEFLKVRSVPYQRHPRKVQDDSRYGEQNETEMKNLQKSPEISSHLQPSPIISNHLQSSSTISNHCYTFPNPFLLSQLSDFAVTQLAVGRSHMLFLTHSGPILVLGSNHCGQLGLGRSSDTANLLLFTPTPLVMESLSHQSIRLLDAGDQFSAILTQDLNLFTCGSNEFGQLGLGETKQLCYIPEPVATLGSGLVTHIDCGPMNMSAMTTSGSLYTWGNNDSYQLGHGPHFLIKPTSNQCYSASNDLDPNYDQFPSSLIHYWPKRVSWFHQRRITILEIESSQHHTIAITMDGKCYVWGKGKLGQLGLGPNRLISTYPTMINVENEAITFCKPIATETTSLALTDDGQIWIIGGKWNEELVWKPRPIQDPIQSIHCHSLVIFQQSMLLHIRYSQDWRASIGSKILASYRLYLGQLHQLSFALRRLKSCPFDQEEQGEQKKPKQDKPNEIDYIENEQKDPKLAQTWLLVQIPLQAWITSIVQDWIKPLDHILHHTCPFQSQKIIRILNHAFQDNNAIKNLKRYSRILSKTCKYLIQNSTEFNYACEILSQAMTIKDERWREKIDPVSNVVDIVLWNLNHLEKVSQLIQAWIQRHRLELVWEIDKIRESSELINIRVKSGENRDGNKMEKVEINGKIDFGDGFQSEYIKSNFKQFQFNSTQINPTHHHHHHTHHHHHQEEPKSMTLREKSLSKMDHHRLRSFKISESVPPHNVKFNTVPTHYYANYHLSMKNPEIKLQPPADQMDTIEQMDPMDPISSERLILLNIHRQLKLWKYLCLGNLSRSHFLSYQLETSQQLILPSIPNLYQANLVFRRPFSPTQEFDTIHHLLVFQNQIMIISSTMQCLLQAKFDDFFIMDLVQSTPPTYLIITKNQTYSLHFSIEQKKTQSYNRLRQAISNWMASTPDHVEKYFTLASDILAQHCIHWIPTMTKTFNPNSKSSSHPPSLSTISTYSSLAQPTHQSLQIFSDVLQKALEKVPVGEVGFSSNTFTPSQPITLNPFYYTLTIFFDYISESRRFKTFLREYTKRWRQREKQYSPPYTSNLVPYSSGQYRLMIQVSIDTTILEVKRIFHSKLKQCPWSESLPLKAIDGYGLQILGLNRFLIPESTRLKNISSLRSINSCSWMTPILELVEFSSQTFPLYQQLDNFKVTSQDDELSYLIMAMVGQDYYPYLVANSLEIVHFRQCCASLRMQIWKDREIRHQTGQLPKIIWPEYKGYEVIPAHIPSTITLIITLQTNTIQKYSLVVTPDSTIASVHQHMFHCLHQQERHRTRKKIKKFVKRIIDSDDSSEGGDESPSQEEGTVRKMENNHLDNDLSVGNQCSVSQRDRERRQRRRHHSNKGKVIAEYDGCDRVSGLGDLGSGDSSRLEAGNDQVLKGEKEKKELDKIGKEDINEKVDLSKISKKINKEKIKIPKIGKGELNEKELGITVKESIHEKRKNTKIGKEDEKKYSKLDKESIENINLSKLGKESPEEKQRSNFEQSQIPLTDTDLDIVPLDIINVPPRDHEAPQKYDFNLLKRIFKSNNIAHPNEKESKESKIKNHKRASLISPTPYLPKDNVYQSNHQMSVHRSKSSLLKETSQLSTKSKRVKSPQVKESMMRKPRDLSIVHSPSTIFNNSMIQLPTSNHPLDLDQQVLHRQSSSLHFQPLPSPLDPIPPILHPQSLSSPSISTANQSRAQSPPSSIQFSKKEQDALKKKLKKIAARDRKEAKRVLKEQERVRKEDLKWSRQFSRRKKHPKHLHDGRTADDFILKASGTIEFLSHNPTINNVGTKRWPIWLDYDYIKKSLHTKLPIKLQFVEKINVLKYAEIDHISMDPSRDILNDNDKLNQNMLQVIEFNQSIPSNPLTIHLKDHNDRSQASNNINPSPQPSIQSYHHLSYQSPSPLDFCFAKEKNLPSNLNPNPNPNPNPILNPSVPSTLQPNRLDSFSFINPPFEDTSLMGKTLEYVLEPLVQLEDLNSRKNNQTIHPSPRHYTTLSNDQTLYSLKILYIDYFNVNPLWISNRNSIYAIFTLVYATQKLATKKFTKLVTMISSISTSNISSSYNINSSLNLNSISNTSSHSNSNSNLYNLSLPNCTRITWGEELQTTLPISSLPLETRFHFSFFIRTELNVTKSSILKSDIPLAWINGHLFDHLGYLKQGIHSFRMWPGRAQSMMLSGENWIDPKSTTLVIHLANPPNSFNRTNLTNKRSTTNNDNNFDSNRKSNGREEKKSWTDPIWLWDPEMIRIRRKQSLVPWWLDKNNDQDNNDGNNDCNDLDEPGENPKSFKQPGLDHFWHHSNPTSYTSDQESPQSWHLSYEKMPSSKEKWRFNQLLPMHLFGVCLTTLDLSSLWHCRTYIRKKLPILLPKLLLAVNWSNRSMVNIIHQELTKWPTLPPLVAIQLLSSLYPDRLVRSFSIQSSLTHLTNHDLYRLLSQLIQTLKYEPYHHNALAHFLLHRAHWDPRRIGIQLFWLLRAELDQPYHTERFILMIEALGRILPNPLIYCREWMNTIQLFNYLHHVALDIKNRKSTITEKTSKLIKYLNQILWPSSIQYPIDPKIQWVGFKLDESRVLGSKNVPLLLTLETNEMAQDQHQTIFKVGDDLRQDALTLQIISLMDELWKSEGLDLRIQTYRCVVLGFQCGIIEIVKESNTTSNINIELGGLRAVYNDNTLLKWLKIQNPTESGLAIAIDNFIHSCAGYSVITFVLGFADRHSDNIMLSKRGHLFHIDFGHFLGNYRKVLGKYVDKTDFVFINQYYSVIGKENFSKFEQLCCDAYNIIRKHSNQILTLFSLMLDSGLRELQSYEDIDFLKERLQLQRTEQEAAAYFKQKLQASSDNSTIKLNHAFHVVYHGLKA